MRHLAISLRESLHGRFKDMERFDHELHYLFLEITRRCNLSCLHCGSDCSSDKGESQLGLEQWKAILGTVASSFSPPPAIVITGGEPLASPLFFPLVQEMARLGLSWGFVSNGLLLDGQAMERLAGTGLIAVTLSLDGPQPVHEWLRDGAGTYARTLESAALVRARAGIHLDIVSCATPRLLPLLDSFSTEILSLSPDSWRLFRIFPKGRARGRRDLLLNSLEFRGLLDWIARARPAFRRKKILLEASCDSWMPFERDLEVRSSPFFCRSGVQIASILADGGISGCSNNDPSLIQGNIMRDDFVTLWMNGFSFFRDPGLRQRGSCAHCTHFPRCQGGSLHSWKLEGASPEFCWEDDGLGV